MTDRVVRETRSGLMVRFDKGIGMIVYSPFNGLIFGVHANYADQVRDWLDLKNKKPPSDKFERMLGPGWFIAHEKAQYEIPYLLPSKEYWQFLNPEQPIVINWLLTGRCPLGCKYCYAEDLMGDNVIEPQEVNIEYIAENILSYNPLAVVLTGGDPLFSPYIEKVIGLLHGRVGIMVDTNAYGLKPSQLDMFQKYRVVVRISFDSEIPRINDELRPVRGSRKYCYTGLNAVNIGSLESAIEAVCKCLDKGITVAIQSVATKMTANDLPALGDKLFRLGVRSWRIHKMAPSSSRMKEYRKLIGSAKQERGMYKHMFSELIKSYENRWRKNIALQLTHQIPPNAVLLVAPDGKFYTESNTSPGKVLLDEKYPFRPRMLEIFRKINKDGHMDRYLNLSSFVID